MNAGTNVSVRGEWPGLVTLRSGWWKAVARPLNDDSTEAVLRAERSTVDFVRRSADALVDLGVSGVHSPPLMRGMDRTYRAAGFEPHAELLLLERDLRSGVEPQDGVHVATAADREAAVSIDANAFVGDWRVGRLGLEDALTATPNSTMLALDDGKGFAIVGVSTEIAYLQRIAVEPDIQGTGRGKILLRASMTWARRRGARTMLLNTQLDNERATQMYRSESFTVLSTRLTIHRYTS
jgi:[ribosomal protein S18]-alanine N-acetyltransferase